MFSVVEICVDYGGVYVFHPYFDSCAVYGVGVCVNVCGVVCVVECRLFLSSGCCLLCCSGCVVCSWRYSTMGCMCVSSCRCCGLVSVVHLVSILNAVFRVICIVLRAFVVFYICSLYVSLGSGSVLIFLA